MKRPEAGSGEMKAEAQEASAYEAKQAVRHGEKRPVGHYVRDLSRVLARLADMFDPSANSPAAAWQVQLLAQSIEGRAAPNNRPKPFIRMTTGRERAIKSMGQ